MSGQDGIIAGTSLKYQIKVNIIISATVYVGYMLFLHLNLCKINNEVHVLKLRIQNTFLNDENKLFKTMYINVLVYRPNLKKTFMLRYSHRWRQVKEYIKTNPWMEAMSFIERERKCW